MAPKKKKQSAKKDKTLEKEKYAKYGSAKYPALNFNRQVANRKEYLDIDYIDKLSPEEKEFMNSFLSETVITNFKHRGEKLYNTKEERKEFYDDNNRRNRCVLSAAKATGKLMHYSPDASGAKYLNHILEKTASYAEDQNDIEDNMIAMIALKRFTEFNETEED